MAAGLTVATMVTAQDNGEDEDNGFFVGLIEDQISSESAKIRLSGVEGLLSSAASVRRITISDPDGTWLRIDNAAITWNRRALLGGRLEIESLRADRITIPRGPVSSGPDIPDPEATPFSIPELPVAVSIGQIAVGNVEIGEPLFGLAARLSVDGALSLDGGSVDTSLSITRLDGVGGSLSLDAGYAAQDGTLRLGFDLSEPADGLVANLLGIPDRPAIELTAAGEGPITDVEVRIDLKADGADLVDGLVGIATEDGGSAVRVDISGQLEPLLDPAIRPFFAGTSRVVAQGRQRPDGGVEVSELAVESAGMTVSGTLSTAPDGFPRDFALRIGLEDRAGQPLLLPGGNGTTVGRAELGLTLQDGTGFDGSLAVRELTTGDITIGTVEAKFDGIGENLSDPAARRLSLVIDGEASALSGSDPALSEILGESYSFDLAAAWAAGQPLRLDRLEAAGSGLSLSLTGALDGTTFDGRLAADVASLVPLSGVAGQDLSGSLSAETSGTVDFSTFGFDLDFDGRAADLVLSQPAADPLLAGVTTLSGRLARTGEGLAADDFTIVNDQIEVKLDGVIRTRASDLRLDARLADLALVAPGASGAATAFAAVTGDRGNIDISANIAVPAGTVSGRPIRDAGILLTGNSVAFDRFDGRIAGSGDYGGRPIRLDGGLRVAPFLKEIRGFVLTFGDARLTGTGGLGGDGLIAGTVDVYAPRIGELADLVLVEASGAVDVRATLSREAGTQRLQVAGDLNGLEIARAAVGSAEIDLTISDILGVPLVDGRAAVRDARYAGQGLTRLDLRSRRTGSRMDLTASALLDHGATVSLGGAVTNLAPGVEMQLAELVVEDGAARASLIAPSVLTWRPGRATLSPLDLDLDGGRLRLSGSVSEELSVTADLDGVPLSLANTVVPELGAGGTVSGDISVTGPLENPDASYFVSGNGLSVAAMRDLGLPDLSFTIGGSAGDGVAELKGDLGAGADLSVQLSGRVPIDPYDPRLSLDLALNRLALSVLDRAAGGLGLAGQVTGSVRATGAVSDPRAELRLDATGVTARPLAEAGLSGIALTANGAYRRGVVDLRLVEVSGPRNLRLTAGGTIPLEGQGLDVRAGGVVPLALGNIALASSGSQLDGVLNLDVAARGRLDNPRLSGSARVRQGVFASGAINLRVEDVGLDATLDGDRINISALEGRLAQGGTVAVRGSVTVNPRRGIPADLTIALRDATYSDGQLVTARLSGDLALSGPVLGAALLSGRVDVSRTEITIPSSFGINEGVLLDVVHRSPPQDVRMTLERAGILGGSVDDGASSSDLRLDLTINAPRQIFVRGRGLDAELGGSLTVRGSLADLRPVGQFDLIRGRLSILTQRIDFDEGSITLIGDLDPRIRLVAETEAPDGTSLFVIIEGRAGDPEIRFTSSPQLPEDEVLAQLLFGRSVADLSPFQVAQLAGAVASLAGGGGGVLDSVRSRFGLADLDVTSDEEGNVGVRAGAYISERVYLDVEADGGGESKATINLDLSYSLKAKASVDSEGESTIGLFWERDY